ncbi:J domain-containing protein [Desulfatiglans anilini]|uniref:J domain-containing protein n=1 Tax=Desulfatiglans anilini TaxID=90728 RepID=UPI00041F5280|nr:J domain-containing protein [Desulfatiglans anilini]
MYLRRTYRQGAFEYAIAESFEAGGVWQHRELCHLGEDPGVFIEYPGGNSFYINEDLERDLERADVSFTADELERLFLPFLDPDIRRVVDLFDRGGRGSRSGRTYSSQEMDTLQKELHSFDKRRLHYLRCGRVDIGNLEGRSWKFLNVLLEKSRDEIEHIFEDMERQLPEREIRAYLFTALHLQTHFSHLISRNYPGMLDPERVDHFFLEDLCRLNRDEGFFRGVRHDDRNVLHPYLARYVALYFDQGWDPHSVWDEDIQDFISRHRLVRSQSSSAHGLSPEEVRACRELELEPQGFRTMGRAEVVQTYRRKAIQAHPDTGGDHETFVRIKEAYECLIRLKH